MSLAAVEHIPGSDLAFWKTAYQDHGPAVMAFLRSRLGSREDAEELMQETFVRAMRAGSRLRDRSTVRGYLFTTAHNLLRNQRRRQAGAPVVESVAVTGDELRGPDSTDARARLRALVDRLADVLETLAPDHREAFKLAVLDRLPYKEIAEARGWSLATVKINVYRARRQVIERLGDFQHDRSEVNR